jgi:hypothetical protein
MDQNNKTSCCGGSKVSDESGGQASVIFENLKENIPEVSTKLTSKDIIDGWKARWGFNRMNYKVNPGIYKVGSPDENSPVLVTANYKLTFDKLRMELTGINAWILVLDTKGVNVWCAAGKGTFGTNELIKRITAVKLHNIVSHRKIILPQLGAPGIAAHIVKDFTEFKVIYGPVLAKDIPTYLKNNFQVTPEMRKVKFGFVDRLILTPIEIMEVVKYIPIIFAILFVLQFITGKMDLNSLLFDSVPFLSGILMGAVLAPVLLPWIPFKSFSLKGWLLGILFAVGFNYLFINGILNQISNLLIVPAISSFVFVNFTGATTFTSLSGVKKELKYALPAIGITFAGGLLLKIANVFI